ncbi:hypothetical protein AMAG_08634 [Allomyces macrogynus ATCC 38327]|uniref:Homologous-pairing protein 2 homolog n=1 Tax=Allomyces macrogynus (strain ATCC 38327) TaxID=578462 RepID=A0A0L0SLY0_ALLM3|nr:hypothetical protein AMAG_08634 [Allomyces macrogynus ATCC 38327]|eukprot:KNE63512.1 hypothetical protein AMAG_08634 [Allomyces macrogynus ATCC 38327]
MPPKRKSGSASAADGDPEQLILEYLTRNNRPFGATDVATGLRNTVSKTIVSKTLAALADRGEITCKTFGKSSIYFPLQNDDDAESPDDLSKMDQEITDLSGKADELKAAIASMSKELASLNASLPTTDLAVQVAILTDANDVAESRLTSLRRAAEGDGEPLVTAADRAAAMTRHATMRKAWVKRRRMFKDMWDLITENVPRKPAELMDELGIETDEMVGVELASIPEVVPPAAEGRKGKGRAPPVVGKGAAASKKRRVRA